MNCIIPPLNTHGIRTIAIGTDYGARDFVASGSWVGEFLISPNYEIYNLIPEIRRVSFFGLGGFTRETLEQFRINQDRIQAELGERWQDVKMNLKGTDPFWGGTFVIGPGKTLEYAYINKAHLDFPDNKDVWTACGLDPKDCPPQPHRTEPTEEE